MGIAAVLFLKTSLTINLSAFSSISALSALNYPPQLSTMKPLSRHILLATLLNLALAPIVQAATNNTITRQQSFTLGLLILGTIALSIYLFVVIFQPEKF
jgi:K+-transporting ATPase KdpF subunit